MSLENNAFFRRAVGNLLAAVRRAKGLDQHSLAKKIGVKQSCLSRIENGLQGINLEQLIAFSRELGLSPNDILMWEQPK